MSFIRKNRILVIMRLLCNKCVVIYFLMCSSLILVFSEFTDTSFSFTMSKVSHYYILINIIFFSPFPIEAPLFGGLHAAVLLRLCPEVSPLLPNSSTYLYYISIIFNVKDVSIALYKGPICAEPSNL